VQTGSLFTRTSRTSRTIPFSLCSDVFRLKERHPDNSEQTKGALPHVRLVRPTKNRLGTHQVLVFTAVSELSELSGQEMDKAVRT